MTDVHPHPPEDRSAYAVEWHRPDPQRQLYRAWFLGAVILVSGALVLGNVIAASDRLPSGWLLVLVVLAVALSAAGPLLVVITAIRSLADDTCLVLRSDGLWYMGGERSFFVRWRDLVSADYDEENGVIRIETETRVLSIPKARFVGIKSADLVARVDDIRRRALLGLIRPANVWGWEEGRH